MFDRGEEIPVKVFLRPCSGANASSVNFRLKLRQGIARGDHRILISDAEIANRMQSLGLCFLNRYIDVPPDLSRFSTRSVRNNKLYVSLVRASNPTAYYEDKTPAESSSSVL